MCSISIIGLGPGHADYILPINKKEIISCDVIIGAKRNIDSIRDIFSKKTVLLDAGLGKCLEYMQKNFKSEKIGVVVSGDTGFYSLHKYLCRNLNGADVKTFAGLSSMSLMFSRLNLAYDDALTVSLHGKDFDIVDAASGYTKVGFLTDKEHSPSYIAKMLSDAGIKDRVLAIGERLSYDDEKITKLSIDDAVEFDCDSLCVVVVYDEKIRV